MEIFKDPDSGIYKVSFVGMNARTITRTTNTKSREDAEQVVAKARIKELELAAKAKSLNGESLTAIMAGRKVSINTAIEEWVKWRANRSEPNTIQVQAITVRQWVRTLGAGAGSWAVSRITPELIDGFVNAKDGTKRASRNLRLAAIRSFIGTYCSPRAYLVGDPSHAVKVRMKGLTHEQREAKKVLPVTEAEFKRLVAETTGFWKHAITLSYWTGLRLSDVCCLEWASIESTHITLWTQKTETRVRVPIAEPLLGGGILGMTFLEMMMEGKQGRYCFPEERNVVLDPKSRSKLSVYASRSFQRAGVTGKSFHSLRHAFVTRLHKAGKTLEEIGEIVGHSSTKTTSGYAH